VDKLTRNATLAKI